MIDDAIIKVAKELDELKEERVEYTVNNIAYKYEIECLKKEKKQLQNNWNELKKWLEEKRKETKICNCTTRSYLRRVEQFIAMQNKMEELESGNNDI